MEFLNPILGPQYAAQSVAYTGTAGTTAGWPGNGDGGGMEGVVIWATSPCYVIVGTNVTATTSNGTPIPANTPIPFKVQPNLVGPITVSAIQIDTGGTVYAKPIQIR